MHPPVSAENDAERIQSLIERCPIGGLVLFNGDRYRTPQTLATLQAMSPFPLLVATDMERGVGQQLIGATVFPHAFAFGSLGEDAEDYIGRAARASAREALAAGIHITLSPVADVHSNPRNPIISTRAFGSNPADVSERVAVYIRSCQAEGLLTTAKHFPGHGDTSTDSHQTLPVVGKSRSELDVVELRPFRTAVEHDVDLIMTAHVAYPGLDESGLPATYSKAILTTLLRNEMGFKGAVITDSLLMEGARQSGDHPGAWAADLLRAGVDILLDVPNPEDIADYLVTAVRSGALPENRLNEAFERVWALKERMITRFGKGIFLDPAAAAPLSMIGRDDHRTLARSVAAGSVRVLTGSLENIHLSREAISNQGLRVVLVRGHTTYDDPTAASLEEFVSREFDNVRFTEVTPETDDSELNRIVAEAPVFAGVVLAVVVKPAAWQRFGLPVKLARFVAEIIGACPVILAALGSPIVLEDYPGSTLGICTYSDVAESQRALVSKLAAITREHDFASNDRQ